MDRQTIGPGSLHDVRDRPRHRWTTDEEWEAMRETITQLYRRDGHELKTIMAIIELQYGFTATAGMFKKRLHSWGLSKTLSEQEKRRLGQMAQRLIAKGEALPVTDDEGNTIPWKRVRRFYGIDKIPLHCLPNTNRKPTRIKDSVHKENDQFQISQNNAARRAYLSRIATETITKIHLQETCLPGPPSRPNRFEETLIFYAQEWYSWCAVSGHPGSNTSLCTLNVCHVQVHSNATDAKSKTLPRQLWNQARLLQDALRQPSAMLLAALLGIWSLTQSGIYGRHGTSFSAFLLASCKDILGVFNPLYSIVSILREQAMLLHNDSPHAEETVDSSMSIVPTVLIDGLENFSNTRNKHDTSVRLHRYFVESLDNMLTWKVDACNPITGIKWMKILFHRRMTMLQRFLRFVSNSQNGHVDPVASQALARLLRQQSQIQASVQAHDKANLPLKHTACVETHCTSLKTMALACHQVTDLPWLEALTSATSDTAPVPFKDTDCFIGMLFFFQHLTLDEKVRWYGQSLAEAFHPGKMWVPQWRNRYFALFLEGAPVDHGNWAAHLASSVL